MQPYCNRTIDCLRKGKMEDFFQMLGKLKDMHLKDVATISLFKKIYFNQAYIDRFINFEKSIFKLSNLLSSYELTEFDFQIIKIITQINRNQSQPKNNLLFLDKVFCDYAPISSKYDLQLDYLYYVNLHSISLTETIVFLRKLVEKYTLHNRIKDAALFKIHLALTYIALNLAKSALTILESIDKTVIELLSEKGKLDYYISYSKVCLDLKNVSKAEKQFKIALKILNQQKIKNIDQYYMFLPNMLTLCINLKKYQKILYLTEDVLSYKHIISKLALANILVQRMKSFNALGNSTDKFESLFNQVDETDVSYNKRLTLSWYELNIKRIIDQKNYKDIPPLFSKYIELKNQIGDEASLINITNTELSLEIQSRDDLIEREKILHETKTKLFSNITHELRTPLTLTMSPLYNILERNIDSETRSDVSLALQNSKRSLYLVNQLLDINKLESGLYKPIQDYGDIIMLIENILHQVQPWIAEKKLKLKIDHRNPIIFAHFDYDKSEKIIYNVISNALKYSPMGGRIEINSRIEHSKNQPFLFCSIKDYGKGIKEEDCLKVFNRFYRGEEDSNNQVQGTGIGLALVKEFIELLGGKVELKTKLGKGSEFILYIPISNISFDNPKVEISEQFTRMNTDYNFTQIEPIKKAEFSIESKGHSLLIVEDNPQLLNFLVQMFEKKYTIYTAKNGKEGYKKTLQHLPDVILSDIMMPLKDGIEMTNELRIHELTKHIPIILLSAKSSQEAKNESRSAGADYYFSKPFHPEDIKLTIQNIIKQQERLKKKYQTYINKGFYDTEGDKFEGFMRRTIETINNNYHDESFNVNSLIKLMNISKSQFILKLKRYCSLGPRELIESVRMHKARNLFETSDLNITEIAYSVGYADSSSFTRVFKRTFNALPIAFRKR